MSRPSLAAVCALVLILAAAGRSSAAAPPPRPPWDGEDRYLTRELRGWRVRVHRQLLLPEHAELCRETLELLDSHLYQITRVVPAGPLAKLRRVLIWVERAHPRHPCMCYHPSAEWLRQHQMNPAKAGGVEIANCRNFLAWTRQQPWMVLHELAHAFHHQVLGFDHRGVRLCHEQAMREQLYDRVLHIDGRQQRHYACTNPVEYFAEMSEAYFGTNDFFPFVRAELRRHDPRLFALLEEVWEVRQGRPMRR